MARHEDGSLPREDRFYERDVVGRQIRLLILENVERHPLGLASHLQYAHDLERVAIYRELRALVAEGLLVAEGRTNRRRYRLKDPQLAERLVTVLRPRVAKELPALADWKREKLRRASEVSRASPAVLKAARKISMEKKT